MQNPQSQNNLKAVRDKLFKENGEFFNIDTPQGIIRVTTFIMAQQLKVSLGLDQAAANAFCVAVCKQVESLVAQELLERNGEPTDTVH